MTLLTLVLAFALGIVAGLRSMTAPAAVAWASCFGWLHFDGTPLAFLGSAAARYVLGALMVGELIADKLPFTPSRTRPDGSSRERSQVPRSARARETRCRPARWSGRWGRWRGR